MKLFRKLHLWLSIPFGVIISIICFSGAMLVFEPEITRYVKKDVYYVESIKPEPLPVERLMEIVNAYLPDSVSATEVTIFPDKNRTYQVKLSKPRRSSIFIDQYSGSVTGKYERLEFFSTMFRLHRWLLGSKNPNGGGPSIGKLIVGISTLIFVAILITGVVIWIPRARKNLRKSLTIPFRNGWRKFWKGLHIAGGMYTLVFVMIMSLTGMTWSFEWYRSAFYTVCGVEYVPRNSNPVHNAPLKRGNHHPNKVDKETKVNKGTDKLFKKKEPGIIINRVDQSETAVSSSTPAEKLRKTIYQLHTGSWGGTVTRIIWFLSAIIGATLPLTGYYIWIKKRFKRRD